MKNLKWLLVAAILAAALAFVLASGSLADTRTDEIPGIGDRTPGRCFEFPGVVEEFISPTIKVSGLTFSITAQTVFVGTPEVGDHVIVKGCAVPGGLVAIRIWVLPDPTPPPVRNVTISGTIAAFPPGIRGVWLISVPDITAVSAAVDLEAADYRAGLVPILVTGQTIITGTPAVGLPVRVEAEQRGRGALIAVKIQILGTQPPITSITGTIRSLPPRWWGYVGFWSVDRWLVWVDRDTRITGQYSPTVGASVIISGHVRNRTVFDADEVNVVRPAPARGGELRFINQDWNCDRGGTVWAVVKNVGPGVSEWAAWTLWTAPRTGRPRPGDDSHYGTIPPLQPNEMYRIEARVRRTGDYIFSAMKLHAGPEDEWAWSEVVHFDADECD